jgi:hypothetical protein
VTPPARRASVACALVALALCLVPSNALAHAGNPNFRSEITTVRPPVPGLSAEVINYDDRLVLVNRTGKDVTVRGYDGEPYVQILSDGEVRVNKLSPSHYLNEDRFAQVEVPDEASGRARPRWETVSKTGRYEWHDHRIHWMSKETPPQVKDEDKHAKIFDWRVPIEVGNRDVRMSGTLRWEPSDSGIPTFAYIALAALAAATAVLMVASRRVRRRRISGGRRGEAWG